MNERDCWFLVILICCILNVCHISFPWIIHHRNPVVVIIILTSSFFNFSSLHNICKSKHLMCGMSNINWIVGEQIFPPLHFRKNYKWLESVLLDNIIDVKCTFELYKSCLFGMCVHPKLFWEVIKVSHIWKLVSACAKIGGFLDAYFSVDVGRWRNFSPSLLFLTRLRTNEVLPWPKHTVKNFFRFVQGKNNRAMLDAVALSIAFRHFLMDWS